MPLLKILPSLISQGSFTGSFSGTSSYARRSLTASYVMGGAAGSSGTSGANGSVGSSGTSGTSATAGSSGTSGVGSPGTSGTAGTSGTSSTATLQTGSLAKQTIFYNVTSGSQNVITGLNLSGNKWGVDIKEEWDAKSVTGDQYYNSCSLLLHLNGTNGSTTFTDNSPSPKTVTSNNGAAISTAQSKFGGASAFFDGTDDLVTVSDNSGFDFGSGDFTIEYWEYRTDSSNNKTALARNTSGRTPYMSGYAFSGALYFYVSFDGSNWAFNLNQGDITLNAWNHFAITRQGNVFRTFKNGSQTSTTTTSGTFPAGSAALEIGRWAANAGVYYQGYIDELRITKGVARYTGSFTTSSIEFYNNSSLNQLQTKYIGLVGGLNDSNVDYGVEKLSDSSLKIRKMTATGQPLSGSGSTLSASVDRVYVNVLDYTNVMVTSSYALTASYVLGGIQTGSISNQTILYNVTTSQENTITGLDLSGNKWDVSVIEEWNSASIVGDDYYNSCSLLMHFNGSNGSTTFIDNSPSPKTANPIGNALISTAQSKFGGSSLYLDGTGDYLTFPSNSEFAYGTGNFTIECWVYFAAGSSYREILSHRPNATSVVNEGSLGINPSNGIFWYTNTFIINYNSSIGTDQWVHVAICRNGSTLKVFANGVQLESVTNSDNLTSTLCTIGANANGTEAFNGYIDELRITKGIARYTSNFTPQISEFPNNLNVTQLQTKYIGLVGGINDSTVDYGVEKLSDTSLKIRKMTASGQPLSGSGALSASVDRVYVNVLNYKNVQTTVESASYASTSSYVINAPSGESFHPFLLG